MKTITRKVTLFLLLCSLSFLSYSQNYDWVEIGKNDGSTYFMRSQKSSDSWPKKVWIKETNKNLEAYSKATGKTILLPNGYSLSLYKFDCSDSKLCLISRTVYYTTGKVFSTYKAEEYEQKWEDAVPDTVGEYWFNKACESF